MSELPKPKYKMVSDWYAANGSLDELIETTGFLIQLNIRDIDQRNQSLQQQLEAKDKMCDEMATRYENVMGILNAALDYLPENDWLVDEIAKELEVYRSINVSAYKLPKENE